jgi:hypothetical protein
MMYYSLIKFNSLEMEYLLIFTILTTGQKNSHDVT